MASQARHTVGKMGLPFSLQRHRRRCHAEQGGPGAGRYIRRALQVSNITNPGPPVINSDSLIIGLIRSAVGLGTMPGGLVLDVGGGADVGTKEVKDSAF